MKFIIYCITESKCLATIVIHPGCEKLHKLTEQGQRLLRGIMCAVCKLSVESITTGYSGL